MRDLPPRAPRQPISNQQRSSPSGNPVDTREKILAPEAAAQLAGCGAPKLVTGYFDPLLAEHAGRLAGIAEAGGTLVVLVLDPERPVLPARARAELVAGLQAVQYVLLAGESSPEAWIELLKPAAVYREEEADRRRAEKFIAHVRERHATA